MVIIGIFSFDLKLAASLATLKLSATVIISFAFELVNCFEISSIKQSIFINVIFN